MARIAGVNLPVQKHAWVGLQSIFGIGRSRSKKVCLDAGVAPTTKIKDLTEAEVERMRQPFTRLEKARTNTKGAGLGLAIVDRVMRMHHGRLDLLPRDGGGLRAVLCLPVAGAAGGSDRMRRSASGTLRKS